MKNNQLVTIVIPTFNSGKYLKETITSCMKQTYKNIEVIIIDDCSTDATPAYLKSINGIKFFERKKNHGISKNVNFAVNQALGDYVLILGHDDVLPCRHIELMMKEFSGNVGFVHCNAIKIDSEGNILGLARNPLVQTKKSYKVMYYLSIDNFINSCGLIFRKDVFLSFGGWDESYKLYGEWLAYIKFSKVSAVKFCQTSHGYYRVHEKNIMKKIIVEQVRENSLYKKTCRNLALSLLSSKERSLLLSLKVGVTLVKDYIVYKRNVFR